MSFPRTERKLPDLASKEEELVAILEELDSCVVAFSGGLDSSYLSYMADKHVMGRVLCVTVKDPTTPCRDCDMAVNTAAKQGLEHMILEGELLDKVAENPYERCYLCKTNIFQKLEGIRRKEGLEVILDGENSSDANDVRPGRKAAQENGVLSPLRDAGLTKEEICILSEKSGLEEPYRAASACLASRFSHGTAFNNDLLSRVDKTEEMLRRRGISMVRARYENGGVRIELGESDLTPENLAILIDCRDEIVNMGWSWAALDLEGYVLAGKRLERDGR